jgi:hypothetical protein
VQKAGETANKALHLPAFSGQKRRCFSCFLQGLLLVVFVVGGA